MNYIMFDLPKKVAVAVSGGKDSLSLILHTQKLYPNVCLIALIVNHNIRPESQNEANSVQEILTQYNIESYILHWNNPIISQTKARQARYFLLIAKCYELNIDTLLLGHHLDDLIETYIMRKINNSGERGLASIHTKHQYLGINILRPLILNQKEDIIPLHEWIEDSSNHNERFLRVQIRNMKLQKKEIINEIKKFSEIRLKEDQLINEIFYDRIKISYLNHQISEIIVDTRGVSENLTRNFLKKVSYSVHRDINLQIQDDVILKRQNKWAIESANDYKLTVCGRFLVLGKKILYDARITEHPFNCYYLTLRENNLFNEWYCPFKSNDIINIL